MLITDFYNSFDDYELELSCPADKYWFPEPNYNVFDSSFSLSVENPARGNPEVGLAGRGKCK